ncbi:MAG: hypothetical protein ACI8PZ_006361 [Myxococcota bacterium]|jgi:hypothetical protein
MHRYSIIVALLAGCSAETGLTGTQDGPGAVGPELVVTPAAVDFGAQLPGSQHSQMVTLSNAGEEVLNVASIDLEAPMFWLEMVVPPPFEINPGASMPIAVFYEPSQPNDSGAIHIESNDPARPVLDVPVGGGALRAGLEVSPNPLEFGSVARPCAEDGALTFTNTGGAPVTITELAVSGTSFSIDALAPELPWTLDPTSTEAIRMWYTPNGLDTEGTLRVVSDNPAGPVTVLLIGDEEPPVARREEFRQLPNSWPAVDIVFTVDRSGSMDDDAARLGESYTALEELLAESDLDYHVMVVTADSGCHNQAIIKADIPGSEALFDAACRGPGGSWTEAGVQILEAAIIASDLGGCNSGFLRDEANHLAVLLSDEPEQSRLGWRTHLDGVLTDVPDMVVSVVVGPPGGGGCAEEGRGYHDAADATGGAKLNLCSADWVDYFEAILETSINEAEDTFELKGTPLEDTIVVTVNDTEVVDWTYDEALNAVVFDPNDIPPPEADIVIEYEEAADCPR